MSAEVLLVTCRDYEDGEPGHELLDAALAQRGVSSAWVQWDDPFVDWTQARLVVVRSAWDYDARLQDFLGWAGVVGPALVHGPEVFRWNTDKHYLVDLAAMTGLPVVPTVTASTPVDLRAAVSRFGTAVVKPRYGSGGRGIVLVYDADAWLPVDSGPWVIQPKLDAVHGEGELSVFVIGGHPVSQLRRVAGRDDIRVSARYGGTAYHAPLTDETALLAVDAVAAATEIVGSEIVYARVDMLREKGSLLVSEVEITEPNLYLDLIPENADKLAAAIQARL